MTDEVAVPPRLPDPDSDAIATSLSDAHRLIYKCLYARRSNPPTMLEIRKFVEQNEGDAPEQTDRRLRELRHHFDVQAKLVKERGHVYLIAPRDGQSTKSAKRSAVSSRVEAAVFERDGYFCAMCGNGPKDGVQLVIDHKLPVQWGGTNDPGNLQVLCKEHNHGKQSHFASFGKYDDAIKQAIGLPNVHQRIGELLLALVGTEVPVALINTVAREQNKGDPTKRLRELRQLGWDIRNKKRRDKLGGTESFYVLVSHAPWPSEGPRAAVNRLESDRKKRKAAISKRLGEALAD
ncbi:MAG: HNH endonuclease signature motif containing protein [Gemmatimonadota bacterium]